MGDNIASPYVTTLIGMGFTRYGASQPHVSGIPLDWCLVGNRLQLVSASYNLTSGGRSTVTAKYADRMTFLTNFVLEIPNVKAI